MINAKETQLILEKHFNGCLKFWERTLKQNRNKDKDCYRNAIQDIANIKYSPFSPTASKETLLDTDTVKKFIESRKRDLS